MVQTVELSEFNWVACAMVSKSAWLQFSFRVGADRLTRSGWRDLPISHKQLFSSLSLSALSCVGRERSDERDAIFIILHGWRISLAPSATELTRHGRFFKIHTRKIEIYFEKEKDHFRAPHGL